MIEKCKGAFVYCLISLLVSSIAGVTLMTTAYLLPIEKIRENTIKSFKYVQVSPEYLNYSIVNPKPDYFTDFIMLNIASLRISSSPFVAALSVPRFNSYYFVDSNLNESIFQALPSLIIDKLMFLVSLL